MSEQNNAEVFAQIEGEAKNSLSGDKLKNVLDFLAYLKESGRTWTFSNGPWFDYMGEATCLISYRNSPLVDATVNHIRKMAEEAGNRWEYDPSPSWSIFCWQHGDDIYKLDSFPVDDDLKEFARENVWKCIRCGGCNAPGGGRRTVFGKVFDNACCNVFHFTNPDDEILEYIKKLMELEKHIIADSKKK